MITIPAMFLIVASVSLLALPLSAWAAESPLDMIHSTVDQVIAVLQDPAYRGEAHRNDRREKLREIVLPHFDTQGLAQRALGVYWRQRTGEEKREFTQLFTDLVGQSYSATIDRYATDVQVFYDQERIDDGYAEVDTRVRAPSQAQSISINYFLHQVGGKWLIDDVQIDNVSMVRNYRAQFSRILNTSSYADLVQKIHNKLQALNTAKS
jgi:phospholipid transport system substrate-binding protein